MKYYNLAVITVLTIFIISCSNDEMGDGDHINGLSGSGLVTVKFDNGFNGNDLVLGTANTVNANGEVLTVNRFSYIVSNFSLVNKKGEEYIFPKEQSYFVINQEQEADLVELPEIPAGEYTTLKFGVGVDQEKYLEGADGQGDLLALAEANGMMWSWQAGYKFLAFEGDFISATVSEPTDFTIHMGSHGSSLDNYKEVSLALPENIKVSDEIDSNIHLKIDAGKILVGATNNIELSEKPVIMVDEEKSPQIAVNTSEMFMVDHVHVGNGHE